MAAPIDSSWRSRREDADGAVTAPVTGAGGGDDHQDHRDRRRHEGKVAGCGAKVRWAPPAPRCIVVAKPPPAPTRTVPVQRLGFRSRLFVILVAFAFIPALVLTGVWGTAVSRLAPMLSGSAAWDRVAISGSSALAAARQAPGSAAAERALQGHEAELSASLTQARRLDFLARRSVATLLVSGIALMLFLAYLASRIAGHLSRQLSRPVQELVGWTGVIARGEALPPPEERGAPEFGVLRAGMRQMADELRVARAAALRAERAEALRESARQVAHELKNPLTPIRFAVARLRREAPPALADTIEVLETESARLDAMARSFAQFGRLPDGPMADVDLGALAHEVVRHAVPPTITATVTVAPALPLVRGQYDALQRALTNLVVNAVEAMPSGGTIGVEVAATSDGVVLRVQDSGTGVAPERLERIWEPYVTDKAGGTGLGLAIVRQTVEAHGGTVRAVAVAGRGACMELVLPAGTTGTTGTTRVGEE